MAYLSQNYAHILNSLVMCYFATSVMQPSDMAELVNRASGSSLSSEDLITIGDRIHAVHRAYNYRCGVRREDDRLPRRLLTPLADGGTEGKVPDLEKQLDEYYTCRQWEPDGKPSKESLIRLGLEDVATELYG